MASDLCRYVDGYYVGRFFPEDSVRSAMAYKPTREDVMIMGYPKTGTTWLQHIVDRILRGADKMNVFTRDIFLELTGSESLRALPEARAIRTHIPFDVAPFSNEAKYVFVCRNPYDCCVSFYYHTKRLPLYRFENGTFDEFLRLFLDGKVDTGDYFDHLLSWYRRRDDGNVFCVTYEELSKDTRGWVLRIADFLGEEHGHRLRVDEAELETLLKAVSFAEMKEERRKTDRVFYREKLKSGPDHPSPKSAASFTDASKSKTGSYFIRRGVVGDWKSHFSADQITMMKQRIAEKTVGTDVMALWKDCDLP